MTPGTTAEKSVFKNRAAEAERGTDDDEKVEGIKTGRGNKCEEDEGSIARNCNKVVQKKPYSFVRSKSRQLKTSSVIFNFRNPQNVY